MNGIKIKAWTINDINIAKNLFDKGIFHILSDTIPPFVSPKMEIPKPIKISCQNNITNLKCKIEQKYKKLLHFNRGYELYQYTNETFIKIDTKEKIKFKFDQIDFLVLDYNINKIERRMEVTVNKNIKQGKKIKGIIGPDYEDISNFYLIGIECIGQGNKKLYCEIDSQKLNKINWKGEFVLKILNGFYIIK